jgi:hypothetical protein
MMHATIYIYTHMYLDLFNLVIHQLVLIGYRLNLITIKIEIYIEGGF